MSAVPIIVWCHPRSCSTAFERSFLQRKDTKVYHEPFSDPFYFGEARPCKRYSEDECREHEAYHSSIEQVAMKLLDDAKNQDGTSHRFLFIKDMAQFIFPASSLHAWHPTSKVFPATDEATTAAPPSPMENPTVLPTALLRRFKHTFLMRTPERSVPSYYKCTQNNAAGFNFFDPAEMGFVELQRLYDWMANPASTFHTDPDDERFAAWPVQTSHGPPPLMDASVLLSHPGYVVSLYCEATQVPFDPSMLSWDQGAVDIWAKWGTYHAAAEQSSGFQETKMETPLEEQPSIVKDTIAQLMPIYHALLEHCTIQAPQKK
ncbi:hypothetical protein ACI68E_001190 [Malassezia pachydermatis]|uniref:Uncharacterized protein n=1 Tax=Malassezia pachydermatis TaxID=77020 RepID=A0A0M8MTA3_9BASI|nr:hypothetical protein Malapachy_1633 [Malassezia pachydermatis]KOS13181.1 hypothetical protein Malapachy_1633 [Malassezia pachydermatis]